MDREPPRGARSRGYREFPTGWDIWENCDEGHRGSPRIVRVPGPKVKRWEYPPGQYLYALARSKTTAAVVMLDPYFHIVWDGLTKEEAVERVRRSLRR